jgi:hypothetical protein
MAAVRLPALAILCLFVLGCALGPIPNTPSPFVPTPSPPPSAPTPSPFPSAPTPSPPPSAVQPQSEFPTACLNLRDVDCAGTRDLVLATLPDGHPAIAFVEVGPFMCSVDPCPETIEARPTGRVMVEFSDASDPAVLDVAIQAGEITTRPSQEVFLVAVLPSSARLEQPQATIELGHCGLLSGVDVDGSYWDPSGYVDMTNPDAINAAGAEFNLTSPTTARLTTLNGLTLELVRRAGGKHLPPCM